MYEMKTQQPFSIRLNEREVPGGERCNICSSIGEYSEHREDKREREIARLDLLPCLTGKLAEEKD